MRNIIARDLLVIARKLVFDEDIVFSRSADVDDAVMNHIYHELGTYIDRIRKNEDVETYTGRRDTNSAMEISIGVSEHEEKPAILKAVKKQAEKLGKQYGVRVF